MAIETQDVRLVLKQSAIAGVKGTVPASSDVSDGTWLVTDLYVGEALVNTADNIMYVRTDSGIKELSMGAADSEIFTTSVTISVADIRVLFTTPYQLIAADATRAIQVIAAVGELKFVTTAYTGFFNLRIISGSYPIAQMNNDQLLKTTSTRVLSFAKTEFAVAPDDGEINTNKAINLTCDGDPAMGDSLITIFLTYRYITLV